MSFDLFGIIRDVFVIAYMFVLRIGVPIIITLMIGAWLKRLLEERDSKGESAPVVLMAGQHCWDVTKTQETEQAREISAQRPDLPCWLALQATGNGVKEMCYPCPVFNAHAPVVAKA